MIVATWRTVFWVASSTSPYSRPFSDTPRLTSFSSSTDAQRGQPVLADRAQRQHEVVLLDRRVRVLEVEAGADLALRLVDGVADLLAVDLGHDIEAGHARDEGSGGTIVDRPPLLGRNRGSVPERPKGADCKSAGIRLRRFESSPAHARWSPDWRRTGRVPISRATAHQRGQSRQLHHGDVEPAVELAADLALDADELEAAPGVQGPSGRAGGLDAGHHGVEARRPGDVDEVRRAAPCRCPGRCGRGRRRPSPRRSCGRRPAPCRARARRSRRRRRVVDGDDGGEGAGRGRPATPPGRPASGARGRTCWSPS